MRRMKYCGLCYKFSRDGVGSPEDHDTYGYCFIIKKCVEPNVLACENFKYKKGCKEQ